MVQRMKCRVFAVLIPLTLLVTLMIWTQSARLIVGDVRSRVVLREISQVYQYEYAGTEAGAISRLGVIPDELFANALVAGNVKPRKVRFTIGISCIYRQMNTTYIFSTLDSLLDNANQTQKEELAIVILLADFDAGSRRKLSDSLLKRYQEHFDSGLIRTIQAPREFYPDLEHLKITYHHPLVRVKWRSKQNYDFAYLMLYSRSIGEFYLQLEDDVTTVPNYIGLMTNFMSRYKIFTCLEFSELGFIAKLFHSYDLEKLAKLLMLFFNEQPNDVTYLHFNELMLQFRRIVRKPTLFQHHGYYSSLSIKRFNVTDAFFEGRKQLNFTLPVMRRGEKGIRGPEEEVVRERSQRLRDLKQKNAKEAKAKEIKQKQVKAKNAKQKPPGKNAKQKPAGKQAKRAAGGR